jgi:hypothetical protein
MNDEENLFKNKIKKTKHSQIDDRKQQKPGRSEPKTRTHAAQLKKTRPIALGSSSWSSVNVRTHTDEKAKVDF